MTHVELIEDPARLERLLPEWDELATACAAPTAAPAWALAWWRHAATRRPMLRLVAVRDGDELVGLAGFAVDAVGGARRLAEYRLLAAGYSAYVAPLARSGREWEVAELVARALAAARPRPASVVLGPMSTAAPWVAALREGWPRRPRPLAFRRYLDDSPTVTLTGSYDAWLARRSARGRSRLRRAERRFAEAGGSVRLATADTVADDLAAFVRLHTARWATRGESRLVALGGRLAAVLHELAAAWLDVGRFRLRVFEVAGVPALVDLYIATGGEVIGVNAGWDETYKTLELPRLAYLRAVEDAYARGDRRLNMGRERTDIKAGFADGNDPVAETVLLPPGPGLSIALARRMPDLAERRLRGGVERALPADRVEQLRELRSSLRRKR